MLVLTRKAGEAIYIGETRVDFRAPRGTRIKLLIDAPPHVRVMRSELIDGKKGKQAPEVAGT